MKSTMGFPTSYRWKVSKSPKDGSKCDILAARHRMPRILSFFFLSSFFLFSFFFRRLIYELTERNSTRIGQMLASNCDLKTHVQNLGYPLPYKSGVQKSPFWATSQLNGNLNDLYVRNETRYRQSVKSVKCVDNYNGSPISSRNVTNFGPQTASNSTCILPTLSKFCFLRHCQATQTETELNQTLPNGRR